MKSHFFFSTTSLIVALLLILTLSASAKEKLVFTPDTPDDTRKIVRAVNPSTSSIDIQTMFDQAIHHYKIDLGTVITVNSATGKFTDIKVGMEVTDFIERDPQTLDSVTLAPGAGDTDPVAKKKKAAASSAQ